MPDASPPPLFDPPSRGGIKTAVDEHLGILHQVGELRLELGAVSRLVTTNHGINETAHAELHKRIDEAKSELSDLIRQGFARIEGLLQERTQ